MLTLIFFTYIKKVPTVLSNENLTKYSVFCCMLSQSLLLADFKDKQNPSLVLKILTKQFAKQENYSLSMNNILQNGKMRVENHTKTQVWEKSSYAQKPRLKIPFKNSISGHNRKWRENPNTFLGRKLSIP